MKHLTIDGWAAINVLSLRWLQLVSQISRHYLIKDSMMHKKCVIQIGQNKQFGGRVGLGRL